MFKGRWARLIQRQYREEELLQFVGRLRPVFRTGRTPVWFALSSVIPEELVVDDLITIDDLVQNHGRLWEAVRRTNGVAHPQALANACPDLFRSASSARAAMKSVGFPLKPDVPGHRASQGFSTWLWKDKKGKQQQAFVRASAPNPIERLQAALGDLMGAEQPVMGWSPDPGMGSRARPRLPDKVEERIGPVARRCVHETAYRDIVGERLLSAPGKMVSVITDNAEQAYPYGKDSVELSVQQATALVAIEGFWADRSGSADDRLMPMVAQGNPVEGMDEVAAYDQMAATFTDGDVPGQAG